MWPLRIRPLSFCSKVNWHFGPVNIHSSLEFQLCQALMVNLKIHDEKRLLRQTVLCWPRWDQTWCLLLGQGLVPLNLQLLLIVYWFPTSPPVGPWSFPKAFFKVSEIGMCTDIYLEREIKRSTAPWFRSSPFSGHRGWWKGNDVSAAWVVTVPIPWPLTVIPTPCVCIFVSSDSCITQWDRDACPCFTETTPRLWDTS